MYSSTKSEVDTILNAILDKKKLVDIEAQRIGCITQPIFYDGYDPKMWCTIALGDSLVKLKLFIENNFNYIETMELIATTRYIFEINIWLNLFKKDIYYGLTYYKQLLKDKEIYWNNLKNQHEREIKFLQNFEAEEKQLQESLLIKLPTLASNEEINKTAIKIQNVTKLIDDKAARNFSLYPEETKYNGFSYQAYIIKKNIIPEIQKSLNSVMKNIENFEKETQNYKNKIPKKDTVKNKATLVNMQYEYEFIFQFTSSLLHATPSSLTTNHKNLEMNEVSMLLRYINVKIQDIIDLSKEY